MAAKPFESRIQDLVYNVDVGIGLRLIKLALYISFVGLVLLVYTATQFFAFNDAEAMEYAQLGRNLAETGELTTKVVRPATLRFLIENTGRTIPEVRDENDEIVEEEKKIGGNPRIDDHPDILHPPLYPAVLAGWFKMLRTDFESDTTGGKYKPELSIVALGHTFTVLTGLFILLIGRILFDHRVGLLGMTVYFLSNTVWETSASGLNLSMTSFLVTAAFYFALLASANRERNASLIRWLLPYILTCLLCVLMVLTRYGAVVIVPAIALYIAISFERRGPAYAGILLAVFMIGVAPWLVRNYQVSGSAFAFVPSSVLNQTSIFGENSFERTLAPNLDDLEFRATLRAVQGKWFRNTARFYHSNIRSVGDGLFISLFITTFLYRFVRRNVHQFRWCVLLAIVLLMATAGYFGEGTIRLLFLFWPIIILYGLAFYYLLLERLNLRMPIQKLAITTLVVFLGTVPLIVNLLTKASYPYPPYLRPYISYTSTLLEPDELMCTDMPWATAWYGDRNSLYLPQTIDEFYEINDYVKEVGALYFTTLTRNQPFVRNLVLGRERTWFPIQQLAMPGDFPLKHGSYLLQGDQLFISDRDRAAERTSE